MANKTTRQLRMGQRVTRASGAIGRIECVAFYRRSDLRPASYLVRTASGRLELWAAYSIRKAG